ncbi:TetR family transcriptional regulator [soil metagenome]
MTPNNSAASDSERAVSEPARRGRGRPPGEGSGSRAAILEAAGDQFSTQGYESTSLRGIAGQAGVDASLVAHYFGNKQRLFAEVVELPVDVSVAVPMLMAGPRSEIGRRVATFVLELLATPEVRMRALSLIRAASTNPDAANILRRRLTEQLLEPLASALGTDRPKFRAAMVMSQVVGLIMAWHVVELEPLRKADSADIINALAPVLQRYLTEELELA